MRQMVFGKVLAALSLLTIYMSGALPHSVGPLGTHTLDWHTDEISKVVSTGMSFRNLGIGFLVGGGGEVVEIDGRRCLRGGPFNIDIRDELAYDVDETVQLEIEIEIATSPSSLTIAYDKNGAAGGIIPVSLPLQSSGRFHVERVDLERARFAGRGDFDTDLMIVGIPNPLVANSESMTICDLRITPSFETERPDETGWLALSIYDERGRLAPARLGLYDESGRTPLPSTSALDIEEYDDRTRLVYLEQEPGSANWPSTNRWVFYTDGNYRARLPAGEYVLAVARGIEYRIETRSIRIEPSKTRELAINMRRWADLPNREWYSGDVHIHMAQRDVVDSRSILTIGRAEDLHVTNSLRMGNMGAIHYPQRSWGKDGWYGQDNYTVVPGQEDPRTSVRGHTIHLNIPQPVRDPSRYLLYHELFEQVSELGGISGYAHIGFVGGALGGNVGLALEVPFGLVDFVEILQGGGFSTNLWFDFLNLGYRIPPAAGSDYPYVGHIGEVRSYVKLPNGYSPDAWFDNLAAGQTFVTNGPILRFDLNGADIGAELALSAGDRISISAQASINPDIDLLERIELIEQGDVVAESTSTTGTEVLEISYESSADHGTWFVVHATGRTSSSTSIFESRAVEAISAPIYVSVDGQRTWKKSEVRALANVRKAQLDALADTKVEDARGAEFWQDAAVLNADWSRQLKLLRVRIDEAKAKYDELIELAD